MLIETEIKTGRLVIASTYQLQGSRSYYLVHSDQEISPLLPKFVDWLKTLVRME